MKKTPRHRRDTFQCHELFHQTVVVSVSPEVLCFYALFILIFRTQQVKRCNVQLLRVFSIVSRMQDKLN